MRDVQSVHRYDRDKVIAQIAKVNDFYSLFGGEPMVLAFDQFEELLQIAHSRWGHSGLQTNGSLITEKHIELFKKYNTQVGISLDGPLELNDSRWAGTLEATRTQSARTLWSIKRLCECAKTTPHLLPSIIVTLHAGNCAADKFPRFVEWFHELDDMGIRSINLHVMEMDSKASNWYLPPNELGDRMIDLWNAQDSFKQLRFTTFQEVLQLLQGDDKVMCVWHTCDPWNTSAVQGIENDGSPSHCSRTNKDGKNWMPAEGSGEQANHATFTDHVGNRFHERQLALYVTPEEYGGCQDCPYWLMCLGQCPGTGEGNDWRMRTSYCHTFKRLFAEGVKRLRAVGKQPLPDWQHRKQLEARMYQLWTEERSPGLSQVIHEYNTTSKQYHDANLIAVAGGWHGDHSDT